MSLHVGVRIMCIIILHDVDITDGGLYFGPPLIPLFIVYVKVWKTGEGRILRIVGSSACLNWSRSTDNLFLACVLLILPRLVRLSALISIVLIVHVG